VFASQSCGAAGGDYNVPPGALQQIPTPSKKKTSRSDAQKKSWARKPGLLLE
jgi:hypothetical protein